MKTVLNVFSNFAQRDNPESDMLPQPSDSPIEMLDKLLFKKNVLITGAGKNIGKSIALEMAKQGANIYFTDINKERCIQLSAELKKHEIESRYFVSDISKKKDIESLCRSLSNDEIVIDVLVNNVGINSKMKNRNDVDLANCRNVFEVNYFGPMLLTKRISTDMIDHKIQGSIIFITSIHQYVIRRAFCYSSSKAALGMTVKELAVELAPHGIRVNGIAPGAVGEKTNKEPFYSKYTPLYHCTINPCFIGRAAVYLASEYFSKYTTGSIIKIDAGLSLYNYLCEIYQLKSP